MGYFDTLIADVFGSDWRILIFCGLEPGGRGGGISSERRLEIE